MEAARRWTSPTVGFVILLSLHTTLLRTVIPSVGKKLPADLLRAPIRQFFADQSLNAEDFSTPDIS